jgi:hypothetical protein
MHNTMTLSLLETLPKLEKELLALPDLLWPVWSPLPDMAANKQQFTAAGLVVLLDVTPATPLHHFYGANNKLLLLNTDPLALLATSAAYTNLEPQQIESTFNQLSNTLKGGHPLYKHLDGLYQTSCPHCQTTINANHFVWQRDKADPQQKYIRCKKCGLAELMPVTKADLAWFDRIETRGVHYHFLLGRVIAPQVAEDDPLRNKVEALFDLYTPRAIYALAEILMKLETIITHQASQQVFKAMLLNCLLISSNLRGMRRLTALPKTWHPPAQFVEYNIWRLFQTAVASWRLPKQPIRVTTSITQFVRQYQHSFHAFADQPAALRRYLPDESITQVVVTPTPPNPTAFALSTLWRGWLMGLKAATTGYPLLQQKWPDWDWYQQQWLNYFRGLRFLLKSDARWQITLPSSQRQQAPAIIMTALQARYEIDEWHFSASGHQLTLITSTAELPKRLPEKQLQALIQQEAHETIATYLQRHAPPYAANLVIWTIWQSLLYSGLLAQTLTSVPEKGRLRWLDKVIRQAVKAFDFPKSRQD